MPQSPLMRRKHRTIKLNWRTPKMCSKMIYPILLVLLLSLTINNCAKADCNSTLNACLNVVAASKAVIADQDQEIAQLQAKSSLDEAIKSDQAKILASPLSDPVKVALGTTVLIVVLELVTGHLK